MNAASATRVWRLAVRGKPGAVETVGGPQRSSPPVSAETLRSWWSQAYFALAKRGKTLDLSAGSAQHRFRQVRHHGSGVPHYR